MADSKQQFLGPKDGGLAKCLQCNKKGAALVESKVYRRLPQPDDVGIEIICCGICHSDLHFIDNDMGITEYPLVPGHEIVGIVRFKGANVLEFFKGQTVAVGTFVDCCKKCKSCLTGYPQCCNHVIWTYNSKYHLNGDLQTFGGYSTFIVVDRRFVFPIPSHLPIAGIAPLLCAGITVYHPLRHQRVGKRSVVGVAGIGGLGHLAIKIARALGARVIAISHSASKRDESKRLGANDFLVMTDKEEVSKRMGTMDVIVDTISANHDITPFLRLLGTAGRIVIIGIPSMKYDIAPTELIFQEKGLNGSIVGSPRETRELLELCGIYNIIADVEVVSVVDVEKALQRLRNGDVQYRFVLDMRTLKDGFKGRLISSTSPKVISKLLELSKQEKAKDTHLKDNKGNKTSDNSDSEDK